MSEKIRLTDDEIGQIAALIRSGKTMKQIGQALAPPSISKPPKPIYLPLPKVELIQVPVVDVKIDYLVDNKRISLGASRPLEKGTDIIDAHMQLYGEILASMANLIEINKDK